MSNLLVVEGATLAANPGTLSIIPGSCYFCSKVKCGGIKVYNTIAFSVTFGAYSGSGILGGNSAKARSLGLGMVLANATTVITLYGSSGGSIPSTITVSDAGQSKAKAI